MKLLKTFILTYRNSDVKFISDLPKTYLPLIHVAAYYDSLECFLYLHDRGFNFNTKSMHEFYPLHYACAGGSIETFIFIVNNLSQSERIQLNYCPPEYYFTPVFLATCSKSSEILHILFEKGSSIPNYPPSYSKPTPLSIAILNRDRYCLQELLYRSNIHQPGDKNFTPLMRAIMINYFDAVRFLVEEGADINYQTPDGKSALFFACSVKNEQIVKFLLENGAFVSQVGYLGKYPIHFAASSDNVNILMMIIRAGADPTAKDMNDAPATFSALCSKKNKYDIMKILFDHGVNPNDINSKTKSTILNSLLLEAPEENNLKVIKLILERGANLNYVTKTGKTLYEVVQLSCPPEIKNVIDTFLKEHPDVKIKKK